MEAEKPKWGEKKELGLPKLSLEHELPLSQLLPGEILPPLTQKAFVLPVVACKPFGIPSLQPKQSEALCHG